jgi:allene oxide cyclase
MVRSRIVVLVVVLGSVGLFTAAATRSTSASARQLTVRAEERNQAVKASGGTLTVTQDLFQNDVMVGMNQVGCFLSGPGPQAECLASSVLPKGQILSAASITVPPPVGDSVTAIVGGTGAYAGARGTIDSVRASDTSNVEVTFHVTLG